MYNHVVEEDWQRQWKMEIRHSSEKRQQIKKGHCHNATPL